MMSLGGLTLQPSTVTLAPGQTQQFSVSGAKGNLRWKATGGTITSRGLYTAGTAAGSFTVTASTSPQGSRTAAVTIAVPTDPGTGGTGGGGTDGGTPGGGGGTTPTGGTIINPGDSIQSAVDANPEGTTFTIKAGVHRRQTVKPKAGMSFIGEPGAILDGERATPRAFAGANINRVTISGLRITNYAPPNIGGAIDALDTAGWIVENNEIDNNSNGSNRTYGLHLGSDMIVRNNKIHHNGWNGISGYKAVGTVIEGNDIYANPPAKFTDSIGEAANMKCYDCGNVIVRNNVFRDGAFRGIWFDRSRPDITIENNRVVNHGEAGIWYEVSYRGTIRGNYIENAGYSSYYSSGWLRGGGIQVTNSPDVSVIGNTVVNSLNGIIGLQASSYYNGPYGASELRNLLVQDNIVIMSRGQTGIAENLNNSAVFDSWNIRFSGNRYELTGIATPFYWQGRSLTVLEWKAGPGFGDLIP
jgi:parallel beta-helix repeat protein